MVRIAKEIDFKRIEELKKKINDESYLDHAVQMIAQELTKTIVEENK